MIPAGATPPSSTARPLRSSRSARTGDRGKRIARPQEPETKPYGPHGTMAVRSGSAGRDTMPEAASRRRCPRRFARTGGTHRLDLKAFGERIAARDPDRQTAEIQTGEIQIRVLRRRSRTNGVRLLSHEPRLRPRHRRDRPRGLNPKGKGEGTPQASVLQQRHTNLAMKRIEKQHPSPASLEAMEELIAYDRIFYVRARARFAS